MGIENINRVTLSGDLDGDPELHRDGGAPIVILCLAYAKRCGAGGERRVETQHVDVVCRGPLAVKVARDLHRGSRIYVDGKLDLRPGGRNQQVHRIDAGSDPAGVLHLVPGPASPGRLA